MTVKTIQKVNEIYHIMKKSYASLKKIFKNHKIIRDKIDLSERMLMQAFMSIVDKTEQIESKREFNKIIKEIKNDK